MPLCAVCESRRVLALALPVRATSPAGGPDVSLARSYPGTEKSAGTPIPDVFLTPDEGVQPHPPRPSPCLPGMLTRQLKQACPGRQVAG